MLPALAHQPELRSQASKDSRPNPRPQIRWRLEGDGLLQAQQEVDAVLGGQPQPTAQGYGQLKYLLRCVNESMRLYPHPPVLLRRAQVADTLPGLPQTLA